MKFLKCFIGLLLLLSTAWGQTGSIIPCRSVRYDFDLVGDRSSVCVVHRQTRLLPLWGGSPDAFFQADEKGNYRFSVSDASTSRLFYQKGFSSLFYEWRLTTEAFSRTRSFSHAAHFPWVSDRMVFLIETRDSLNRWIALFADTIDVNDPFVLKEKPLVPSVDTLRFSGPSHKNIDLVLLSEGYTASEMEKFARDARRLTDSLFGAEPFCRYVNRFNILAVSVPSAENGTDMPELQHYRNTAFNAHFHTFLSPRYLTTSDMKTVYDAVDGLGWDHLVLLVNSERYGGGGFYNFYSIATVDNERSPFVFIHEFGHSFAGLGDEYIGGAPEGEEYYSPEWEPWEPNLTTRVRFEDKWKNSLAPDVPVPTPRDSVYRNRIGVYEGGGYQAKGVYSPFQTCWMKEQAAGKFCPVCRKAIEEVILKQSVE